MVGQTVIWVSRTPMSERLATSAPDQPANRNGRWRARSTVENERALSTLLMLAEAAVAVVFFVRVVVAVLYPYDLDYGEGPLLDQVARLSRFENLYRSDLSQAPFVVANYPPVYHAVQLPFLYLFGPSYWYGRLISAASIVATAAFVGLTVRALCRDRRVGVIAGLAVFASSPIYFWVPCARVDSLALA